MDTDKIKVFGARVKVDGTGKLAELERAERACLSFVCAFPRWLIRTQEKMKAKVNDIAAHGINCFVNRQLIYNYPESLLADKGIVTIEHADFEGVERLSLVTGGEIASTFERPDLVKLGKCDLIEEIIIGEDKVCPQLLMSRVLTLFCLAAHQILWSGCWRSLYGGPSWLHNADGGRSRAFAA